ncbi:ATP synthase F1 subunit epsilon [Lichenicoccus roseus]|uniref:ATP synthase epsilon chain n=1 Tax=Lichenicoccus roseus TaxID=2683649 RepID=A0A5R9J6V5_9PROT|nr:ATP synthase F1 subunit epsilon [Lichenicoccus roseus]TLU73302.1 ATP synthase F1 subunit epsilon [Lichenicoccus roseus]
MPIEVEIVSPEKRLLSRSVEMVVMPGSEGDLAAMEEHAPMIVLLRGGLVSLYDAGRGLATPSEQFFVAGGFAEITGDRCTILADEATPLRELSRSEGEARLAEAERAYDNADKSDITTLDPYLDRLQSARAHVEAAER